MYAANFARSSALFFFVTRLARSPKLNLLGPVVIQEQPLGEMGRGVVVEIVAQIAQFELVGCCWEGRRLELLRERG